MINMGNFYVNLGGYFDSFHNARGGVIYMQT